MSRIVLNQVDSDRQSVMPWRASNDQNLWMVLGLVT